MRRRRGAAAAAVLTAALALAGCASSTIEVPAGAPSSATPEETASAEPTEQPAPVEAAPPSVPAPAGTEDELDCTTLLPLETIESAFELPPGFVTESDAGAGCAWGMAGNPSALVVQALSGVDPDAVVAQQATGATEASDLGDAAFFRPGDPAADPAAELVVQVGDRMLTVRSAVGDQEQLETLASDVLTEWELDAE